MHVVMSSPELSLCQLVEEGCWRETFDSRPRRHTDNHIAYCKMQELPPDDENVYSDM